MSPLLISAIVFMTLALVFYIIGDNIRILENQLFIREYDKNKDLINKHFNKTNNSFIF